jgi:hypothetical protein
MCECDVPGRDFKQITIKGKVKKSAMIALPQLKDSPNPLSIF